jgi:hypothetical protein
MGIAPFPIITRNALFFELLCIAINIWAMLEMKRYEHDSSLQIAESQRDLT